MERLATEEEAYFKNQAEEEKIHGWDALKGNDLIEAQVFHEEEGMCDLIAKNYLNQVLKPDELHRITSYNVCYTKLLRAFRSCGIIKNIHQKKRL